MIIIKLTIKHPASDNGNRMFNFYTYYKNEVPLTKLIEKKENVAGPALTGTPPTPLEYWNV